MSAQQGQPPVPPGPALSAQAGPPQQLSDAQINEFLENLLGGDLPGEGFLNPAAPGENEPRITPTPDQVRDELLRAVRVMAMALQLPYSEEKKADLGHALLAASQSYLLLDPSLDEEGLPAEGPGSKAHSQAAAALAHPTVAPNAAEEKLNSRTKTMQQAIKGARGQSPKPRPRVSGG
jgi:hypothetical protein